LGGDEPLPVGGYLGNGEPIVKPARKESVFCLWAIMKISWQKRIKEEKGAALLLVLILMLLGSLMVAPLLGFMSTGFVAAQGSTLT
jgi:hypothetical protein